ncbi:hypothetical protein [Kibdelosporangium philippinense]|uniref:hypothetical protein n=1 Tax=Kibdelosporangium philippinense TaxID=211113 RepID=UPI00360C43ED
MDEDMFVMPAAWKRYAYPRRDRGTSEYRPDKQAIATGAALLDKLRTSLERTFGYPRSDQTLADAGRTYLKGEPTPIGAAVVRMAATADNVDQDDVSTLVHYWIAEHGVAFAAAAAASCAKVHMCVEPMAQRHWQNNEWRANWVVPQTTGISRQDHWVMIGVDEVRRALAAASDAEYAAAEAALEPLGGPGVADGLRAFIMPTRSDWVREALSGNTAHQLWLHMACSVGTPEDLAMLPGSHAIGFNKSAAYSVLDAVGTAIAPRLATELDQYQYAELRKRALAILAVLPTDEAFTILLDRLDQPKVQAALHSAMKTFPHRAARLLAARAGEDPQARTLFQAHLKGNPDLELPGEVRAVADALDIGADTLPDAPADMLPPLLVDPPWTRPRKKAKAVVVTGLEAPEPAISWAPGEQEQWAAVHGYWDNWCDDNWPKNLELYRTGKRDRHDRYHQSGFFARGPEEMIRPLLAEWKPEHDHWVEEWGKVVVAKYGLDALPAMMRIAPVATPSSIELLSPIVSAEIAVLMAGRFVRLKSGRKFTMDWFARHGGAAVRMLIPAALGKPGRSSERRGGPALPRHARPRSCCHRGGVRRKGP